MVVCRKFAVLFEEGGYVLREMRPCIHHAYCAEEENHQWRREREERDGRGGGQVLEVGVRRCYLDEHKRIHEARRSNIKIAFYWMLPKTSHRFCRAQKIH